MTETRQYIGFGDVEKFLVKSYKCLTGGSEFDIDKYGPYVDAVKNLLVPSLEKQILFFLERFVYNKDYQQSSYHPYLTSYKESMLTAYAKYNEIGTSINAIQESLTIDHLIDFFGHSLLTNSRLAKISNDFNAMGIEKNLLGYLNVLNYVNEKDFWICSSSSSITSRHYSSICSPNTDNILSDMNAEKCFHLAERTRGHKRPRKRAATHINRKHYKLERVAQLPDRSFRVTESLYDLLMSSWDLHDILHTKRKLKRRSNFASNRRSHRKTDWKTGYLTIIIRKLNGPGRTIVDCEDRRNSEVRTSSSLPCKVEQLLKKLDRVDPSLTWSQCRSIKKKFYTKLYNVCSCLNNLLSRMNVETINSIHLVCEIRKDYLNFKLKHTSPSNRNSSLFSARIMTCEALYRYGIRKDVSRQKLESQSSWAMRKANELSSGEFGFAVPRNLCQSKSTDFANNGGISSIEITFTECGGIAVDPRNAARGLTCDPDDLEDLGIRNSLSINDIVQKLELSPFRLKETPQSFRIRSKIRDIVRSIMICRQEEVTSPGRESERRSISIQAIVSTYSLNAIKQEAEVFPVESKSSETLMSVSFAESKIFPSRSEEIFDCENSMGSKKPSERKECGKLTGSGEAERSVIRRSCLEAEKQSLRTRGTVRPNKSVKKSRASSSSREPAKSRNKNKYKICRTSEEPVRSEEFTGSYRRPCSKDIVESIASKVSNALARANSNDSRMMEDENDYEIDVTVEIEDSQSSDNVAESISRHTHILPSMKSVRLGTSSRYFPLYYANSTSSSSLSSSESEVLNHDNFTTINKSMVSSGNRSTTSTTSSQNRIKQLIKKNVCEKLSGTDNCRKNSSKAIVSGGKYYLSIPSSKTSHVVVKREISESSSKSNDSLDLLVCNGRKNSKTSSSKVESLSDKSSDFDIEISPRSSRAATFDKDSVYGCIEDRLANRYLKDILDDYSGDVDDSPKNDDIESRISQEKYFRSDDYRPSNNAREKPKRYYDSEVSSEEDETIISQSFMTEDDTSEGRIPSQQKLFTTYVVGRSIVQGTPILDDYGRVGKFEGIRWATGWSTCTIKSSNSGDFPDNYPPKYNSRLNMGGRGDSHDKIFTFGPLNIIEKYKKRFQNIDKSFRAKLLQYARYCKKVKNNLQKQICLDDIYETSRTSSISSSNSSGHKYNTGFHGG